MKHLLISLITILFLVGCTDNQPGSRDVNLKDVEGEYAIATFAGGCFWCLEPPFDQLDGVISTSSGFTGGNTFNPSYDQVKSGTTGHTECVQVLYDPKKITYEKLLKVYWMQIDPTQVDGQFVDKGPMYRTGIFFHNDEQKAAAIRSMKVHEKSGIFKGKIITEITAFNQFFRAEEYHQDFYMKSPLRYKYYRFHSGRDEYLKSIWGKDHINLPL